jgi:hypothetical protein
MNVFVFLSRSKDRWDSLCIPVWRGVQHRHQSLCRRQCLRQLLQRLRTWAVGHPQHNSEVVQWLKAYAEEAALLDGDEDMAEVGMSNIVIPGVLTIFVAPAGPVRPASPLPPGVPTGPRNQNRYKDRDNNAPAVEGLDYGGTIKDVGGRTPSGEPEDRLGR